MRYVYVVHGFGEVTVFASLQAARQWRDKWARACDITRASVNITPADGLTSEEKVVSPRLVDVA